MDLTGCHRRFILVVLAWVRGLETGLFQIGCGFCFAHVAVSLRAWHLGGTHISTSVDLSLPHYGPFFRECVDLKWVYSLVAIDLFLCLPWTILVSAWAPWSRQVSATKLKSMATSSKFKVWEAWDIASRKGGAEGSPPRRAAAVDAQRRPTGAGRPSPPSSPPHSARNQ